VEIGIVGCGFVADLYMRTLKMHPGLRLAGVYDRDPERLRIFSKFHGVRAFGSLAELLEQPKLELVANLTNPDSHFEVSKVCLLADKHVYSEKPLATSYAEALELVELSEARKLELSSAPCSLLSESAQTMGKALRERRVGRLRAVYAEMDDGLVHLMPYRKWKSDSGSPWPYIDEFKVGCTLEHAGYSLTWLAGFFGPARAVTAFASLQVPHKTPDLEPEQNGPDLSVACIEFPDGLVARLTCSLVAPHDHQLRVYGDEGVLWTDDTWRYRSPVYLRKFVKIRRRMLLNPIRKRLRMQGTHLPEPDYRGASKMDFCRGLQDMADAIMNRRTSRLSARFSLHVTEMALAIHAARAGGVHRAEMRSTFQIPEPMSWVR
jgi:predicted dehydrogenase